MKRFFTILLLIVTSINLYAIEIIEWDFAKTFQLEKINADFNGDGDAFNDGFESVIDIPHNVTITCRLIYNHGNGIDIIIKGPNGTDASTFTQVIVSRNIDVNENIVYQVHDRNRNPIVTLIKVNVSDRWGLLMFNQDLIN